MSLQLPEAGRLKPASVFNPKGHLTGKNPLATTVIDLTHDCPSELNWRPIKRVPELKPPEPILKDKINLKEWEQQQINEYLKWCFDRRIIDQEVYKRFQLNGESIRMATS